jgi:UDP-glucose 4-epimerase
MGKKVLITGASGYIGGAIRAELEVQGWNVFSTSRLPNASLKMDFSDPSSILNCCIDEGYFDLCVHVAASHEVDCMADPLESMSTNVLGTAALLELCVEKKIKRFIYISTFHVFGMNKGILHEDVKPDPLNYYGLTHSLAEESVFMYNRKDDIQCSVIRLPNILGAPLSWESFNRWSLAPFDFCLQAAKSGSIVLKTAGNQKRNWLSINSMAVLVVNVASLDKSPKCVHLVGTDISIANLAKTITASWESKFAKSVSLIIPQSQSQEVDEPFRRFSTNYGFSSSTLSNAEDHEQFFSDFVGGVGHYLTNEGFE